MAVADTDAGPMTRGRRISFWVLAGLLTLFAAVLTEGVVSLVRGWIATGEDVIHRVHDIQHGVFMGVIGTAAFASQARWPTPAGAQTSGLLALGFLVGMVGGQVFEVPVLVFLILVAVFLALHPDRARLLEGGEPSPLLNGLAAVGGIPLLWYAWDQLAQQRTAPPTDPHVVDEPHYAGAAVVVLIVVALAATAARRPEGWRLSAWLAGIGMGVLGVASLLFPDHVGSFGRIGGALALAWSLAYIAAAELVVPSSESSDGMAGA